MASFRSVLNHSFEAVLSPGGLLLYLTEPRVLLIIPHYSLLPPPLPSSHLALRFCDLADARLFAAALGVRAIHGRSSNQSTTEMQADILSPFEPPDKVFSAFGQGIHWQTGCFAL